MNATVGMTGEILHRVQERDSAVTWGNDLPVLATPVLLWLAELACMRAVQDALGSDEMTVGMSHDAEHLAPTPIGCDVRMHARLIAVDGRRLHFEVEGSDQAEVVYRGTHGRATVSPGRFEQRIADKSMLLTEAR
jgi:fluoroacetyl-CoA thioesterase